MLHFIVTYSGQEWKFDHASGPVEFGLGPGAPETHRCKIRGNGVEDDHVRVEYVAPDQAKVTNLSRASVIAANDGDPVPPGSSAEVALPAFVRAGEVFIEIERGVEPKDLPTLSSAPRPTPLDRRRSLPELGSSPAPEDLALWLETIVKLHRTAASSPDFYDRAARSLVDLVGLDRGLVLLRDGTGWKISSRFPVTRTTPIEYSTTILDQVVSQGLTLFQTSTSTMTIKSLIGVQAVVASPIFDSHDVVIGAVYGVKLNGARNLAGIGPLEAQVVQLIATALGSSLALFEQEAESSRLRVQFEQFFSATLAQELQKNPRLLEGQEREVTVLFCDIRGFSRLSERLGPIDSCRLLSDLMDCLTARIRDFGGVVVDFMGDGLLAMWNAPIDQSDHALQACRAGLAMVGELPCVSDRWRGLIGADIQVGVGINTGTVFVGNTGSRFKFKYGPLGHPVNLASRVEGATKHFGLPILITDTHETCLAIPSELGGFVKFGLSASMELSISTNLPRATRMKNGWPGPRLTKPRSDSSRRRSSRTLLTRSILSSHPTTDATTRQASTFFPERSNITNPPPRRSSPFLN